MKKLALIVLLCFVCVLPAMAGDAPKKHPIDVQVDKLLAQDESTAGMVQAFARGQELWDKELNKIYQELTKALSKDEAEKKILVEAQRAWMTFRDQEMKLLHAVYSKKEGTMYRPMAANDVMQITRARALALKNWLLLLQD
ncbi:MAG: lysozyme inhibitor LprI family protein [Candidatus Ozemobacteraceae bacterium]